MAWLAANPLPKELRYYSVVTFSYKLITEAQAVQRAARESVKPAHR
jgi:hypothetical protein